MSMQPQKITRYITDDPLGQVGEDPYALKEEAIALIQQLAGDTWTDHNTHDPGITTLDILCYLLSDLGYRLDFPMADLLTEADGTIAHPLPLAHQLLPMGPVTLTDLRKVIIDIPGINNAWVYPDTQTRPALYFDYQNKTLTLAPEGNEPLPLRGLFRVVIELEWDQLGRGEPMRQAVRQRLMACRNLGEDLTQIDIASTLRIAIQGVIEIESLPDPYALLGLIFQQLNDYIAPAPRFRTYEEMKAMGYEHEQLFEGPLLDHGFLPDDELRAALPKAELRTSDLIRRLLDIEGVQIVKSLVLVSNGTEYPWYLAIADQQIPRFDEANSEITLQVNGISIGVDLMKATNELVAWRRARRPEARLPQARFPQAPAGQYRNPGSYHSLQEHFPEMYGVGEAGLPDSTSILRKAQAAQLKGYLLFFDQVLANQFAQLEGFKQLISPEGSLDHSRFSQPLLGQVPGAETLLNPWQPLEGINPLSDTTLHASLPAHNFQEGEALWLSGAGHQNGKYRITVVYPDGFDLERIEKTHTPDQRHPAVCRTEHQWATNLQAMTDPSGEQLLRLHRVFDHLLARYAETCPDHLRFFADTQAQHRQLSQILLRQKQQMVLQYAAMSKSRGEAFNYTQQDSRQDGRPNISGLESRIGLLMGMGHGQRPDLTAALAAAQEQLQTQYTVHGAWPEVWAASLNRNRWKVEQGVCRLYGSPAGGPAPVLAEAKQMANLGGPQADQAWLAWWEQNLTLEGLHMVEHILLRPTDADQHPQQQVLMLLSKPIHSVAQGANAQQLVCQSPNHGLDPDEQIQVQLGPQLTGLYSLADLTEDTFTLQVEEMPADLTSLQGSWHRARFRKDPFSLQVSVVLPKWPGRLQNPGFRTLLERTLRDEIPAHLCVYFHWLDAPEMEEFEHYLGEWHQSLAQTTHG